MVRIAYTKQEIENVIGPATSGLLKYFEMKLTAIVKRLEMIEKKLGIVPEPELPANPPAKAPPPKTKTSDSKRPDKDRIVGGGSGASRII